MKSGKGRGGSEEVRRKLRGAADDIFPKLHDANVELLKPGFYDISHVKE